MHSISKFESFTSKDSLVGVRAHGVLENLPACMGWVTELLIIRFMTEEPRGSLHTEGLFWGRLILWRPFYKVNKLPLLFLKCCSIIFSKHRFVWASKFSCVRISVTERLLVHYIHPILSQHVWSYRRKISCKLFQAVAHAVSSRGPTPLPWCMEDLGSSRLRDFHQSSFSGTSCLS
jgi:hypothetical protein